LKDQCYFGPLDDLNDNDIRKVLESTGSVAVVGASDDPSRHSYGILRFLLEVGYKVFPINPNHEEVLGRKCFPTLKSVDSNIDMVNVFRNPAFLMPIVQDAIDIKVKYIWMQLGVVNDGAYDLSVNSGIKTVMNRCIKVEYNRIMKKTLS